jgi:hypothetical protein
MVAHIQNQPNSATLEFPEILGARSGKFLPIALDGLVQAEIEVSRRVGYMSPLPTGWSILLSRLCVSQRGRLGQFIDPSREPIRETRSNTRS